MTNATPLTIGFIGLGAMGGGGTVEADERRVADGLGDVVIDLRHVGSGLSLVGEKSDGVIVIKRVALPQAQADKVAHAQAEGGEFGAGDLGLDVLAGLDELDGQARLRTGHVNISDDGHRAGGPGHVG